MSATIINEANEEQESVHDARIMYVDQNSWPECEIGALEMTLVAGHLDMLESMLSDDRTRRVLALDVAEHEIRIQKVRDGLAVARIREVVTGGRGSLVDSVHPLTIALQKSALFRAQSRRTTSD